MSAAESYLSTLRQFGRVIEVDIAAVDRLGIPVTSCVLMVEGALRHLGNGYGADAESAHVGGLGELAEGVLSAERMGQLGRQARRASYCSLRNGEGVDRVADPATLCLPAGSDWSPEQPLSWLPTTRVRTGETVWVPAEFVASEPDEVAAVSSGKHPLITPITNGLGAGLDVERALTHGITEILQRHTNGLRFRALDQRSPVVDRDGLPGSVRTLMDRIERSGIELVIKHAATAFGVCSTYVMGIDPAPTSPLQVTACGEAAHPSAQVSITKAILEYANSRVRKSFCFGDPALARPLAPADYWAAVAAPYGGGEIRATEAMQVWADLSVAELTELTAPDTTTMIDYAAVTTGAPALSSAAELLTYLLDVLGDHDVLASIIEVGGVHVAKVIIPGLEVETMSYGRLGELGAGDLLSTDLDLVRVGEACDSHRDAVVLTRDAEERLGGSVWYSRAAADRLVGRLYPLYREPRRHTLRVG
ncbi:MAG: YcaO-like family protein [Propionibacteriaceae bacterium]